MSIRQHANTTRISRFRRFCCMIAALTLLAALPCSIRAQLARWNNSGLRPRASMPARGPVPTGNRGTSYLDVAGIGRVPVSNNVNLSPGHSAFSPNASSVYLQTGSYSPVPYSAGRYSAGRYSANRYGRSITGVSRGHLGTRDYWQGSYPGGRSVIVAPTWGWSPYGGSYFTPYAGYYSSSLSVTTVPITPFNAHTVPIINPPCWYSGYGCASLFGPVFYGSPVGAACGWVPGYSFINISLGSNGGWGYGGGNYGSTVSSATYSTVASPAAELHMTEPAPVIPNLSGQSPLLNEFHAISVEPGMSSLPDKIHSLRYQASGDNAFRDLDFASAEIFYRTAVETAPERPAGYLRLAFARIAQGDYDDAARWLKTGLDLPSDRTQSWVPWQQLYGSENGNLTRDHAELLWDWVAERPLSTDRLLVAAAFQKLRGYDGTADELLKLVHENGEPQRVESLLAMIDVARREQNASNVTLQSSADALRSPARKAASPANDVSAVSGAKYGSRLRDHVPVARDDEIRMNGAARVAPGTPTPPTPNLNSAPTSSPTPVENSGTDKTGGSIRPPQLRIPSPQESGER